MKFLKCLSSMMNTMKPSNNNKKLEQIREDLAKEIADNHRLRLALQDRYDWWYKKMKNAHYDYSTRDYLWEDIPRLLKGEIEKWPPSQ